MTVESILRSRLQSILDACSTSGFGATQSGQIKLGEITSSGVELVGDDDTEPLRGATAKVTCYMTIDEGCCNISGNAHGGFLAWLIDVCSSLPLLALAGHERWITSGVSSNINVFYIAAAPEGMEIKIISTLLQQGKTSSTIDCRIEEVSTGKLIAVGTHVKQDVAPKRPKLHL